MEAPHHKYCKCPDCELFAQMQAHFGTNEPEPNTRAGEALKPCPFCGGEAIPEQYVRDGSGISCGDCNTKIWEYHGPPHMPSAQDRCRVRWNTRPLPQWMALSWVCLGRQSTKR